MRTVKPGDYIKARFWPGETIWAKVLTVAEGSLDCSLANDPDNTMEMRPEGCEHFISGKKFGDIVSCGIDEVMDCMSANNG